MKYSPTYIQSLTQPMIDSYSDEKKRDNDIASMEGWVGILSGTSKLHNLSIHEFYRSRHMKSFS